MINIKVSSNFADVLDKEKLEVECEKCNHKFSVTYKDARTNQEINCPECQISISLVDQNGDMERLYQRAREFDNSMKKYS